MKVNNNRDYESVKGGYYEAAYDTNAMPSCGMDQHMMGETMPGCVCPPIYECPRETVCHRYICHEVPQE